MSTKLRLIPLICLIAAEFLSQVGNQIAAIAIPILVLQFTHSPIATGIAGAGAIIPIVLAAFIGGTAIDQFGAWRVSVAADVLSGLSVLLLPFIFIAFKSVSSIVIFGLVFAGALFDPTAVSARHTLVPKFARLAGVPLDKVNGYRGSLENGADLLGPIVGAGLISWIGTVNTLFVNAASFFLCAMVFAISVPRLHRQLIKPESSDPIAGIQFILQQRQLRSLTLSSMVLNFVLLPFLGLLLPVFVTQKFADPALLGICLAGFGMAATLGALSYAKLTRRFSRSTVYYSGLLLTAIAILLCAIVETPITLVLTVSLGGLLLGAGNPLEQTILQEATPSRIAGQVFTSHSAIAFTAGLLGLLIAGVITELTSVEWVFSLSGSLLALASTIGWYFLPLSDRKIL
jgi:MFS family permease